MKIMIVEDDRTIASILAAELTKWGYSPFIISDFQNVLDRFREESPQLVLMDIQLPAFNGYYWCQEIRKISQVPLIFISSRTENMDIVMAIQMGGDDYIQKPFDLNVGSVILKTGESKLLYEENELDLTRNELRTLELLFQKKGTFVAREEIMVRLWEDESFIDDNTLAVTIARLRKKLKNIGLDQLIVTKKGMGYSVTEEEL